MLDNVLDASVAAIVVDVAGNVCATVLHEAGMLEQAGDAHLRVANELIERFDIKSLSRAIPHYEKALCPMASAWQKAITTAKLFPALSIGIRITQLANNLLRRMRLPASPRHRKSPYPELGQRLS